MSIVIPFISQLAQEEKEQWLSVLNHKLTPNRVVLTTEMTAEEIIDASIAIVANPDPSELKPFSNLVWVQSLWAGVDRLLKELPQPSFKLARLEDPRLSQTMAEAVLTWTLYLHRQIPQYLAQQKQCQWLQHQVVSAAEQNIGILGLGRLGQESAQRLKDNGFNVSGWSRSPKSLEGLNCFSGKKGLDEMLTDTHILVVLLPLTVETNELIDSVLLKKLPKGASIINFARGDIIKTEDLIAALDSEHLSHAVLDVFVQEPLPSSDKLWQHDKITVLPHVSAPTNVYSASEVVCQNIENYLQQGILPNTVDIDRAY
ncbi:2-hydroxyacid dehydrogenase [Thalassotalea piscium]